MQDAYLKILPAIVALAGGIFIFKHEIILILFSKAFLPMEPLFLFQLLGDIFKIGSWLIAMNMLAKSQTKLFIGSEIIFSSTFVGFSILFIHFYGLLGTTIAFALNYALYWLAMGIVYKKLEYSKS